MVDERMRQTHNGERVVDEGMGQTHNRQSRGRGWRMGGRHRVGSGTMTCSKSTGAGRRERARVRRAGGVVRGRDASKQSTGMAVRPGWMNGWWMKGQGKHTTGRTEGGVGEWVRGTEYGVTHEARVQQDQQHNEPTTSEQAVGQKRAWGPERGQQRKGGRMQKERGEDAFVEGQRAQRGTNDKGSAEDARQDTGKPSQRSRVAQNRTRRTV